MIDVKLLAAAMKRGGRGNSFARRVTYIWN